MESLPCPRCGEEMVVRELALTRVNQCPAGHGVFLDRADLGSLVEAENEWHLNATHPTAPLPRITPDMVLPPQSPVRTRAWVETLFG